MVPVTVFPTSTIVEYYPLITKPPGKLSWGPQNSDMSQISNAVNMMIIDGITIGPSCLYYHSLGSLANYRCYFPNEQSRDNY